jgi:hypothetical protein
MTATTAMTEVALTTVAAVLAIAIAIAVVVGMGTVMSRARG